jgi:CRISPR/Cas system-associated endoribonuclease Cas2
MNDAIEKYGKNLRSTIKTITKEATISKQRLLEAMKNIGMEVQSSIFELILSKMALKSMKLNSLEYTSVI